MLPEWLHEIWLRIRAAGKRRQFERDLEDELAFHVAASEEKNRAAGLVDAEAHSKARKRFGNAARVQELCREMWTFVWFETLWQDVRYGARTLRKNPGFAAIVILTLALGIGATTAIFSLVNAVLIRSLPYGDPERLVYLWTPLSRFAQLPADSIGPTYADFYDIQNQAKSFSAMTLFEPGAFNLGTRGSADRVGGARISGNFFPTLETRPQLGRLITQSDDVPGGGNVVVISHALWNSKFSADPGILGQSLEIDGRAYQIIGVMPPGFEYPRTSDLPYDVDTAAKKSDLWFPIALTPEQRADRDNSSGDVVARLRPGVSLNQAQAEMSAIMARLDQLHAAELRGWSALVQPFLSHAIGPLRRLMWLLFGAVSLVLLIACSNAANLLLARAASRTHELGVRAALGAGRKRLIRQLLTEAVSMACAGGALGVGIALAAIRILQRFDPGNIPRLNETSLDSRVLIFSIGLSLLTGIIFGILPALAVSRTNLSEMLKQGGARGIAGSSNRLRHGLIVIEIGLAVVLLSGSALLIRSYLKLQSVDLGFSHSTLTMSISLDSRYTQASQRRDFFNNALGRISRLPGVQAAGAGDILPLSNAESLTLFEVEGYANTPDQLVESRRVTQHYFEAMGVRLIAGRLFNVGDYGESSLNVIVNQSFAKNYYSGADPIGQHFRFRDFQPGKVAPWSTVVGVIGDIRHSRPEDAGAPQVYLPFTQSDPTRAFVAVRTSVPPAELIPTIRGVVREIDPVLAVADIRTMDERVADANARRRFQTFLLAVFAGIALFLATVGLYGLMAYAVKQRTSEIGIRIALGAQRRDVLRLILGQGILLTLAGLALGLVAALALTRVLVSLLFGVVPSDPATLIIVPVVLIVISLLACYVPARRATRVDPMVALRYE
ncbi:MAG: ABC transporter permease [Candidatus Acidiferrales bacterium]